ASDAVLMHCPKSSTSAARPAPPAIHTAAASVIAATPRTQRNFTTSPNSTSGTGSRCSRLPLKPEGNLRTDIASVVAQKFAPSSRVIASEFLNQTTLEL